MTHGVDRIEPLLCPEEALMTPAGKMVNRQGLSSPPQPLLGMTAWRETDRPLVVVPHETSGRRVALVVKGLFWLTLVAALFSVAGCVFRAEKPDRNFLVLFPIYYRGVALLLLGGWCWGLNVLFLDRYRLEYTVLFDMEPGVKISSRTVFLLSAGFSAILFANVVVFTTVRMGVPSTFLPLLLYSTLFLVVLWPRSPFREPRQALLRVLLGTFLSPLAGVHFVHVIVGDLLTSYSKVFHDLYGASCVILTSEDRHFHADLLRSCRNDSLGMWVTSIPTWLRLVQCLSCYLSLPEHDRKHLANALKYASALPVLFFSYLQNNIQSSVALGMIPADPLTIQRLWLLSLIINSVYSYYWDVYNDWGLGSFFSTNLLLRDRMLFPRRWWYYAAIFSDLTLRFTWSLQLSPHWYLWGDVGRELLMFVLESVEILRRCMWINFRMEWQALCLAARDKNHSRQLSVEEVPISP
eukprot:RCo038283